MRPHWLLLACVACSSTPAPALEAAEVPSLTVPEIERRLAATERATRGLGASRDESRLRAGHAGLAAYRRHRSARLYALTRALLDPVAADRDSAHGCSAATDLAELAHAAGDDVAAAEAVRAALADGGGSVACRTALRALGESLGVESTAQVHGSATHGARILDVKVLGAERPDSLSARVVVTLDQNARGELLEPTVLAGERVARLRFDGVSAPEAAANRDVNAGGLLRVRANATGLDLVVSPDATVRSYVLESPVRWIVDVDAGPRLANAHRGVPRLVVLDPGHGGDEHGAEYEGLRESHFVLDIAGRAAQALRTLLPRTRVVLTRTTDDEVSLEQRSALANSLDADLFVSIHLNDADVPVVTGGITSFVLDTGDDQQARRLAAREHATTTDRVGGLSLLLAGLHREGQVAESRQLASFVHAETLRLAHTVLPTLPDRGVRTASYYVLVGTRMPSMLVECSFMTRPEERTALRTEVYRQRLGEGIARGIARYSASR